MSANEANTDRKIGKLISEDSGEVGANAPHHNGILITRRLYYEDSYLFKVEAEIIAKGKDEKGGYLAFEKTIFHPQGGGQPADKGFLSLDGRELEVVHVGVSGVGDPLVRHYGEFDAFEVGMVVSMSINPEHRRLYARLHSGGHFLANVLEGKCAQLRAIKGHHFPDGPYVEFAGFQGIAVDVEVFQSWVDEALVQEEASGGKVVIAQDSMSGRRTIQLGSKPPCGCGGTHVQSLQEIGKITIKNARIKKDRLKVSYRVVEV